MKKKPIVAQKKMPPPTRETAITELCLRCGMCCDGTIFADVKLQPGDGLEHLEALGAVHRKGRFKLLQPCPCLDGLRCRVYAERPARCAAFDCRLLQRVAGGDCSLTVARRAVEKATAQVAEIKKLLLALGQTEDTLPLNRRYGKVMRQPIDLSAGERIPRLRGRLMVAVGRLTHILEKDFLG